MVEGHDGQLFAVDASFWVVDNAFELTREGVAGTDPLRRNLTRGALEVFQ